MLSPSPENRPTLDVFQAALNEDLEDSDDAAAEAERAPRTPPLAPATAEYATVATVTASTEALNHQAPAPDDPDYPWHGCAQRSLQPPVSAKLSP
jgi:hypothetical protein